MRIAHYIASTGYSSRRAASRLITEARVHINQRLANHHDRVTLVNISHTQQAKEHITIDNQLLSTIESKQYWMINKQVGTDCRLLPDDPSSLIHLLPKQPRLYPVGRLDKDSRGLLLLTNDGQLNQRLMHPKFQHTKSYEVQLNRPFDDKFLQLMANGVSYKNLTTLPCQTRRISADRFEIILTQGLNRQIRRMSQVLGYKVIDLKRHKIQTLALNTLAEGKMRQLTQQEKMMLLQSVKLDVNSRNSG